MTVVSPLVDRLEVLQRRLEKLWERSAAVAPPGDETLEELAAAVGELHVAAGTLAEAGETVEEERRRYRELFDLAPDGYLVTDALGTVTEANQACALLLGIPLRRICGRPLAGVLRDPQGPGVAGRIAALQRQAEPLTWEARAARPGGEELRVLVRYAVAGDRLGGNGGVRWLLHDVSDRSRATEQELDDERRRAAHLAEESRRLAELDKMKSDFLKLASHELRGPLVIISGYLSMMSDGTLGRLPPAVIRALALVLPRCDEMNHLIEQLLDTARLEDSRLQLRRRRFDLRDVVTASVVRLRRLVGPGAHEIGLDAGASGLPVDADPERIATIVQNLLDNAVKYSPGRGRVVCRVRRAGAADRALVEVSDTGLGLEPEAAARLFERFGRVRTAATEHIPGTGLGLYLSRELARLHGGDLRLLSSAPGRGSTFALELPLAPLPGD